MGAVGSKKGLLGPAPVAETERKVKANDRAFNDQFKYAVRGLIR